MTFLLTLEWAILASFERRSHPASTRRCPNAGLKLAQRLRRWANFTPALGQRLVSACQVGALCSEVE